MRNEGACPDAPASVRQNPGVVNAVGLNTLPCKHRAIASKLLSTMMTKIKQKLTTEGTENIEIYLFLRK